jgi:hypothetical protein
VCNGGAGLEPDLDSVQQGKQQHQGDAVVEQTLAFDEDRQALADAEAPKGRQHGDGISRGNHGAEQKRYGP